MSDSRNYNVSMSSSDIIDSVDSLVMDHQPHPVRYIDDDAYSSTSSLGPHDSSESIASTIASSIASEDHLDDPRLFFETNHPVYGAPQVDYDYDIPELPPYMGDLTTSRIRSSNPEDFARLFPSTNRLSIRHDEFTTDGNMNLRVDTDATYRDRKISMQLFHLRLNNLARREFSLRRYCRNSGREVCSSKRHYEDVQEPTKSRIFMRNKSKTTQAARDSGYGGSLFGGHAGEGQKFPSSPTGSIHSTSDKSTYSAASIPQQQPARPVPTNIMKLEFSNYARVEIKLKTSSKAHVYEFEWWGEKYQWRRVQDPILPDTVSYHLYRSNTDGAIAHIVPETRSPNEIRADRDAHGWIPPCHMWISNPQVLQEMTDHADVIVATGLMSLTDDCIRATWKTPTKSETKIYSGSSSIYSADSVRVTPVCYSSHSSAATPHGLSAAFNHKKFLPRMFHRKRNQQLAN